MLALSLGPPLAVALVRALCVAVGAVLLARPIRDDLACAPPSRQRALLALNLLLVFAPSLLVAYAYSSVAPSLPGSIRSELFAVVLLLVKHVPIAALILFFLPVPALSPEGRHCRRLVPRRGSFALHGALRQQLVVGALVFVLAFQEFELLTLNSASSWTVALFDAHAGGLTLPASLEVALVPVACQLAALALLAWGVLRGHWQSRTESASIRRSSSLVARTTLALAAAFLLVIPIVLLAFESLPGLRPTLASFRLAGEARASLVYAALATAAALVLAHRWRASRWLWVAQLVCCVPGLFGSLVLALVVQTLFQLPVLRALYDTSVPLLLALTLLAMPRALALSCAADAFTPAPAFHLARMLRGSISRPQQRVGRELQWVMRGRAGLLLALMLFGWATFELVASAILAPTGAVPVSVPLFNLMHYGHSAMLSAMVLVVVVELVIVAALSVMACAAHRRWVPSWK